MSSAPTPPPEYPEGQESDPPEIHLAVSATIALLEDLRDRRLRLMTRDDLLRIRALLAVMRRLHTRFEGEPR